VSVVHLSRAAGNVTACGTGPGPKARVSGDPRNVTCRKCPQTVRWDMWVHNLSWNEANKRREEERLMDVHQAKRKRVAA
jgi:hypothetical protein